MKLFVEKLRRVECLARGSVLSTDKVVFKVFLRAEACWPEGTELSESSHTTHTGQDRVEPVLLSSNPLPGVTLYPSTYNHAIKICLQEYHGLISNPVSGSHLLTGRFPWIPLVFKPIKIKEKNCCQFKSWTVNV